MDGAKLKEIRNKIGLSQTEFANKVGISLRTFFSWEKNHKKIADKHIINIHKIIKKYKIPLSNFEYEVIPFEDYDPVVQQEFISQKGNKGWDLVSVTPLMEKGRKVSFRFYFKREIK